MTHEEETLAECRAFIPDDEVALKVLELVSRDLRLNKDGKVERFVQNVGHGSDYHEEVTLPADHPDLQIPLLAHQLRELLRVKVQKHRAEESTRIAKATIRTLWNRERNAVVEVFRELMPHDDGR